MNVSIDRLDGSHPQISVSKRHKPSIGPVHRALRTATRNNHATIDRLLLRFDLERSKDYKTFLNIQLAALSALRGYWRPEDDSDFEQMINCILADLCAMGSATDALPNAVPAIGGPFTGLGISYFVRSSRLQVAALRRKALSAAPCTYLQFTPLIPWSTFVPELESMAGNSSAEQEAIRAAQSAYALLISLFERRRYPVAPRLWYSNAASSIACREMLKRRD